MKNHSVRNGIYGGIAVSILFLISYFVSTNFLLVWSGWIGFIIYIYFMYRSAADTRADGDGLISFGEAVKSSFITYAIAGLIGIIFLYILTNIIDPSLVDSAKEVSLRTIEKVGSLVGEEGLEAAREKIENQNPYGVSSLAVSYGTSLLIGLLISLIIAAIVKRSGNTA